MLKSNVKYPVQAPALDLSYINDANGEFLGSTYPKHRDEFVHRLNGYDVAVKALRLLAGGKTIDPSGEDINWPGYAQLVLKDLGELDKEETDEQT